MSNTEQFNTEMEFLKNKISKLKNIMFSDLITKEYLQQITVGEIFLIDNVEVTKIYENETCMQFISKVPPKSGFPTHWHDIFELNIILSGQVTNKDKTYLQGDVVRITKQIPHDFVNNSNEDFTIISTTFTDFETNFKD